VEAILHAHATNNRINTYLIRNLPEQAWRAAPPGGKGRDIASIAAHLHNVRLMWLKAIGAGDLPMKLDPATVTKEEAIEYLDASFRALETELRKALESDGRIKGFKPDVASFFAYLMAHDAHHRGQITMLARQAGYPVSQSTMFGLWEWGTR
jgi:uncharacterized damage-inducible protein DinB